MGSHRRVKNNPNKKKYEQLPYPILKAMEKL